MVDATRAMQTFKGDTDLNAYFDKYVSKDRFAFDDFMVRIEGPENVKGVFNYMQDKGFFTASLTNIKVCCCCSCKIETLK